MIERQPGSPAMIHNNIRDTFYAPVSGNSNRGERRRTIDKCVHRDKTFDASVQKNVGIAFEKAWVVAMRDRKKEIVLLSKITFYPTDDGRTIKVTNLLSDDTNHIGTCHS